LPQNIQRLARKKLVIIDAALGRFFGMSPQFWLNLQTRYDLEVTEDLLQDRLEDEVHALHAQTG